MTRSAADVLEDLDWLDQSGVGAIEAAERINFPTAHAMEKWLERHDRYPLWLRFKARDPEGIHDKKARAMQAVEIPARDHIATLLLQAEKSPAARTRRKAERIRLLLDDLTQALEVDKAREDARKEVERLERQLASARARLRGEATDDGPRAADVRAWAAENGVACPERGKIPHAVRDAYLAATEAVA